MAGSDTLENRKVANAKAREVLDEWQERAEQHGTPTFQDEPSAFINGFEEGAIWIADHIEPTRLKVNAEALIVTWQTLVIFRDIALNQGDADGLVRGATYSQVIGDMAGMIHSLGYETPEIPK